MKAVALKIDWERGMVMYQFLRDGESLKAPFSLPAFKIIQGEERILLCKTKKEAVDIPQEEQSAVAAFNEAIATGSAPASIDFAAVAARAAALNARPQPASVITNEGKELLTEAAEMLAETTIVAETPEPIIEADVDDIVAAFNALEESTKEDEPYVDEEFEVNEDELTV